MKQTKTQSIKEKDRKKKRKIKEEKKQKMGKKCFSCEVLIKHWVISIDYNNLLRLFIFRMRINLNLIMARACRTIIFNPT